jgi:triacylglycerol lipase
MGWFTAFPEDIYRENRAGGFEAVPGFAIATAGALAWAAQLSCEIHEDGKFDRILEQWRWQKRAVFSGHFASKLPLVHTKGFMAGCGGGTVIAFAGTEPTDLLNWITDLDVHRSASGIADGFAAGVEAVWAPVAAAVAATAGPLFFAGHSLGAALAAIVAMRLIEERVVSVERIGGVYTIGMPRVGNAEFAARYNLVLGEKTYRLVHGDDIVPKVPPCEAPFGCRHVGRRLSCSRGEAFAATGLQPLADERPEPGAGLIATLRTLRGSGAGMHLPEYPAEHALARRLAGRMRPPMRDHLPDCYLRALGTLK